MYSGLDVQHFCKTASVEILDREGLEAIGDIVETIATARAACPRPFGADQKGTLILFSNAC